MEQNEITKDDLSSIFEISKEQFKNESWNFSQFESSFSSGSSIFLVSKENEKIVGFLLALDAVDSINLLLIATKEDHKRKGIGKELLSRLETFGKKIWFEVRESNFSAQSFYENCGFTKIGIRKKYYANGENALIYEK